MSDEIKCVWCGDVQEYDWDNDSIKGLEPSYVPLGGGYEFAVYMCPNCDGILAIMTYEPNGSSLLIHDTRA